MFLNIQHHRAITGTAFFPTPKVVPVSSAVALSPFHVYGVMEHPKSHVLETAWKRRERGGEKIQRRRSWSRKNPIYVTFRYRWSNDLMWSVFIFTRPCIDKQMRRSHSHRGHVPLESAQILAVSPQNSSHLSFLTSLLCWDIPGLPTTKPG